MRIGDIAFTNLAKMNPGQLAKLKTVGTVKRVSSDTPVADLLNQKAVAPGEVILLTEPGHPTVVKGVFAPSWVHMRIVSIKGLSVKTDLAAAIGAMTTDPAEVARSFHHEWLNTLEAPTLIFCDIHDHWIDTLPCPRGAGG